MHNFYDDISILRFLTCAFGHLSKFYYYHSKDKQTTSILLHLSTTIYSLFIEEMSIGDKLEWMYGGSEKDFIVFLF